MPYVNVPHHSQLHDPGGDKDASGAGNSEGLRIYYQLFGRGETKVLLIAGLACTLHVWKPQIVGLCGADVPNGSQDSKNLNGEFQEEKSSKVDQDVECGTDDDGNRQTGVQVCAFDNRGVGRSSVPTSKSEYTTTIMATDAKALLDHLGWKKVHICGHSMGGMIACKLAVMVPGRVASLALISVTGGGYECLPKMNYTSLSIAFRFIRAKSLQERALVDLDTHYTKDYLNAVVGKVERKTVLHKEYTNNLVISGMQPKYGFNGHAHACWMHCTSASEIKCIRSSRFPIVVVHGKGDVIAQIRHGRNLASRLSPLCQMVELPGGHLVTHENNIEVNQVLVNLIQAGNYNIRHFESGNPLADMEIKAEPYMYHFYRRRKQISCFPSGCL
ncbi:hypothetical protein O6H91_Y179100 [Diphasiastrum complanatum]|nr:hypothetical protein O6H91_Y179100 [Diphasiastrum complanatum]